jgi:hypothetical protein
MLVISEYSFSYQINTRDVSVPCPYTSLDLHYMPQDILGACSHFGPIFFFSIPVPCPSRVIYLSKDLPTLRSYHPYISRSQTVIFCPRAYTSST